MYLPMLQAVKEIKTDLNSKKFEPIKSDLIENMVEHNYIYLIDKKLLKNLQVLLDDLEKYNKINELTIAKNIVIGSFKQGFSDLYGSIIEGYSLHYDEIHDCEYECEEIAEEVFYFDVEYDFITDVLKHRKNLDVYYHYDMDKKLEEIFVNHQLVELYEAALNNDRKIQLEEWRNEKGLYIAYYYDFNKQYDNHEQIKVKNIYRDKISNQLDIVIQQIQDVIKKIVKNHEKKGLKY